MKPSRRFREIVPVKGVGPGTWKVLGKLPNTLDMSVVTAAILRQKLKQLRTEKGKADLKEERGEEESAEMGNRTWGLPGRALVPAIMVEWGIH
jgi:hypothetical protein